MTGTSSSVQGRVLLTGAGGFVGLRLLRQLLNRGYHTYVIARDAPKLIKSLGRDTEERLRILTGDLLEPADLARLGGQFATQISGIDFVIHLVGGGPLTSNRVFSRQITDLNYTTTVNLLGILENSRILNSVSLLIYFSSLAAMGMSPHSGDRIIYNEGTPCHPVLAYERAKLQTESLVCDLAARHKLKTLILRLPQIYGRGNDPLMSVINLMRKNVFPVVKDKIGSLPLVHVDDVVEAVCAVLESPEKINVPCEIGLLCEKSYSYAELANIARGRYGNAGLLKMPFWFLYVAIWAVELLCVLLRRPEPLNRRRLVSMTKDRIVDCSKFVNTFHFRFRHNVESFLAELI